MKNGNYLTAPGQVETVAANCRQLSPSAANWQFSVNAAYY
jgi:hypothetical protein